MWPFQKKKKVRSTCLDLKDLIKRVVTQEKDVEEMEKKVGIKPPPPPHVPYPRDKQTGGGDAFLLQGK